MAKSSKSQRVEKLTIKTTLTKVCGIAYEKKDINRIVKFCNKHNFRYYYIKHLPDDDNLKNHFHFIIESDSNHRFILSSLVSETFTINLFQRLTNVSSYLRYMTHIDYTFKKHYDIDKIVSNVDIFAIESLIEDANPNKLSKEEVQNLEFISVVNAIEEFNFVCLSQVISYCLDYGIKYNIQWSYTLNVLLNERKKLNVENKGDRKNVFN